MSGGLSSEGISVVTTCYNERENLRELIPAIRSVLAGVPHEIIVVDDSSPDGSYEVAAELADVAVRKKREGQTKGLRVGIRLAKYPVVVTIDSDLENDPRDIPRLLEALERFDVVIACRDSLPRVSERIFSRVYGRRLGVSDVLSNFRAFRREVLSLFDFGSFESYGAEFLIKAKRAGLRVGCVPIGTVRRERPRLGGSLSANLKILLALANCLIRLGL